VKKSLFLLIPVALALANTGCITEMKVVKVSDEPGVKGQRVDLPAPFIVGTPKPDGTIVYTVQYFPDPDQEYAIRTWTFLSKQKADISRTIDMYVQKMTLAQDTTAVASQLSASVGNVAQGAINTLATQQAANTAAQQAAATAYKNAVTTRQADLDSKKATVDDDIQALGSAESTLQAAQKLGDADAIKAAQTAVNTARLSLQQAEVNLQDANTSFQNFVKSSAANQDNPTAAKPAVSLPKAQGVVIYQIVELPNNSGIKLVPVNFNLLSMNGTAVNGSQLTFETSGKPKTDDGGSGSANHLVNAGDNKIEIDSKSLPFNKDIPFDTAITSISDDTTFVAPDGTKAVDYLDKKVSGKTVTLTFKTGLVKGSYALNLKVLFEGSKDPLAIPITVKVN
jgi:hypothetical protein